MRFKAFLSTILGCLFLGGIIVFTVSGCRDYVDTPQDIKYIEEFHRINFAPKEEFLHDNQLSLYIDYSTCNKLGQNSHFFQEVSASLVNRTTAYYSIKGNRIQQENLSFNNVYTLLRNINEVNYAELAQAANMMADSSCESVMITDGEYYTPSIAKGHDNDPYLSNAFKAWILKGYDIHIISEPYSEPYHGKNYSKKRFYILFTDDRMPNNIYNRIRRTVDFRLYPDIDEFHISASHPLLKGNGTNSSMQHEVLQSKTMGYGTFEVEDWDGCDWGTIEDELVNAVDENTGNFLPNGATIIQMGIDKNSFGCYKITALDIKAYDINAEYASFYNEMQEQQQISRQKYQLVELEHFIQYDKEEFAKHSRINLSFDRNWFDPSALSGKPYNYFKIDLSIAEVCSNFDKHEERFEFESISQNGTKNVSVASSIKQCLADDEVLGKINGQHIYSIYIKSEQN